MGVFLVVVVVVVVIVVVIVVVVVVVVFAVVAIFLVFLFVRVPFSRRVGLGLVGPTGGGDSGEGREPLLPSATDP